MPEQELVWKNTNPHTQELKGLPEGTRAYITRAGSFAGDIEGIANYHFLHKGTHIHGPSNTFVAARNTLRLHLDAYNVVSAHKFIPVDDH